MIVSLALAAIIAGYDCQIEAPRAIGFDGAKVTGSEIGLPPAALKFRVEIQSGNPMRAKVAWDGDPFDAAGQFPTVSIAPGSYAFSAYSSGPCLFTEQACLSQFNLVDLPNGKANLILAPVALTLDKDKGVREPFAVLARGQCSRTDLKK